MASTRTLACSGCLIEAIECRDEIALRRLLSATNFEFRDIYWVPRFDRYSQTIEPFEHCCKCFPLLSSRETRSPTKQCTHSMEEPIEGTARDDHIPMSVVATAMLHTTAAFNALQILIESQKFDLSEPLVFHLFGCIRSDGVSLSAVGTAILLDMGPGSLASPTAFPLLKTLERNSLLQIETDLRIMFIICYRIVDLFHSLCCHRSNALDTLMGCFEYRFSEIICDFYRYRSQLGDCSEQHALETMSILSLTFPVSFKRKIEESEYHTFYSTDLLQMSCFLEYIFYVSNCCNSFSGDFFVSHWIRYGWICVEENEHILYDLVSDLHASDRLPNKLNGASVFRITRQLLALGLFRKRGNNSKPQWPRRCLIAGDVARAKCNTCLTNRFKCTKECQLAAPLVVEFFQNPLSLQQLSRIEIRRSVGMKEFENRIKKLPLPPSLLAYVWRANEMLVHISSEFF